MKKTCLNCFRPYSMVPVILFFIGFAVFCIIVGIYMIIRQMPDSSKVFLTAIPFFLFGAWMANKFVWITTFDEKGFSLRSPIPLGKKPVYMTWESIEKAEKTRYFVAVYNDVHHTDPLNNKGMKGKRYPINSNNHLALVLYNTAASVFKAYLAKYRPELWVDRISHDQHF